MNERIIERLRELDLSDNEIALVKFMYENGDVTEEDIFDIGEDEEFNIENIDTYELNEPIDEYDDAITEYTSGTNVSYKGEVWYVFDDYDDAVKAATNDVLMYLDEMGVEGINIDLAQYVDEEWFEDAERESFENYCYDIATEGDNTYDNRLVQECYDNGLIDDDDFELEEDGEIDYTQCTVDTYELVDRLANYLYDDNMSYYKSAAEWYRSDFGDEDFETVVENNDLIDKQKISEYVVDEDGIGHTLASYDGEDNEYEFDGITYYIYRTN